MRAGRKMLTIIALTTLGVAVAVLLVWGWRQGGLALLQLRGLC